MPYFAVICRDKPDALDLRMATRDAHLAYIETTGAAFIAGPLLHEGGPRGSLLVIEAEDIEAAQAWAANDPYARAGLFDSVEIAEWKRVIG